MTFDVFISYSHQDQAAADAVCARLEAEGIRCWIAPRDVAPGVEWAAAIVDAIDRARVMVLVFSSHANESRQIYREVQRAFDHEISVVPLRVENVVPEQSLAYYMGPVHWLDAITPPLEAHLGQLMIAVRSLLDAKGRPPLHRTQSGLREPERARFGTQITLPAKAFPWRWIVGSAGVVAIFAVGWLALTTLMPPVRAPAQLPSAPAVVQSPTPSSVAIEGTFKGTMECEKLPWTSQKLNVAVTIVVQGNSVTFSRGVYSNDGRRQSGFESGEGRIDADGVVQLKTSWVGATNRFDGSYLGRLTSAGGTLSGKQVLLVDGGRHERACVIVVQKSV